MTAFVLCVSFPSPVVSFKTAFTIRNPHKQKIKHRRYNVRSYCIRVCQPSSLPASPCLSPGLGLQPAPAVDVKPRRGGKVLIVAAPQLFLFRTPDEKRLGALK